MHETYYTPEQLAQLEARREEVGEDEIAAIEREWAELSTQMKTHRDAGTDPTDPEVRRRGWRDPTDADASPAATPASPRASAACIERKVRRTRPEAPSTRTCWRT